MNYGDEPPPVKCPECRSHQTKVIDSRPTETTVKRRRACMMCGHRWSTQELAQENPASPLDRMAGVPIKKDHKM